MNNSHKPVIVLISIIIGFATIVFIIDVYKQKEDPVPETKVQLVEEKCPVSVIEENEKCKDWGGEFSADTSERTFGKYLDMKCEKEIGVMNGLYKTETLFNYSIEIRDRND